MRTRGRALPFATATLAFAAALLIWSPALAVDGSDLVALAKGAPYNMDCTANGADQRCIQNPNQPFTRDTVIADISPGSGALKNLVTIGIESDGPLIPATTDWMIAMQTAGCGDKPGQTAYLASVTGIPFPG